jgi:hypothetical protein
MDNGNSRIGGQREAEGATDMITRQHLEAVRAKDSRSVSGLKLREEYCLYMAARPDFSNERQAWLNSAERRANEANRLVKV